MSRAVSVRAGMPVRGRVAAPRATAGLTGAQVQPLRADLEAVLAGKTLRMREVVEAANISTGSVEFHLCLRIEARPLGLRQLARRPRTPLVAGYRKRPGTSSVIEQGGAASHPPEPPARSRE